MQLGVWINITEDTRKFTTSWSIMSLMEKVAREVPGKEPKQVPWAFVISKADKSMFVDYTGHQSCGQPV